MTKLRPSVPLQVSQSQRDRFIEVARQHGADEDEAAFDAKLAVIARQKPKDVATPEKDEQ